MARYSEENEGATLSDFLEEVSLLSDVDNYDADADTVVMMTIHSAKGLEFDNVFIVGMEDGLFPSLMSFNDSVELEEERRLAYVGVTRARKKLFLTSCAYRMMYGRSQRNKISRFAKEIPDSVKKIIDNCFSEPSYDDSGFGTSFSENSFYSSQSSFSGSFSSKRNEPMFDRSAVVTEKPKASGLDYKVGDIVRHRVFGDGLVISMTPMANDTLVEVSFEAGTKKIMANFAKLTKK
ncbi:MAG: ATP-binding domain-containing protein, partial [Oscillospiraceae bacterium]|nr:ATP-binding domain-containing protein [Oscillospiraceae bacterium]